MALPDEPYFEVLVESFDGGNASGRHGRLHVRPVAGQGLDISLYVACPREMREDYPLGTMFMVTGKLSNREGGVEYLQCPHQWGYSVMSSAEARRFLSKLKTPRGR
jgi:hypothetical protein